jgi:hypothetical protein
MVRIIVLKLHTSNSEVGVHIPRDLFRVCACGGEYSGEFPFWSEVDFFSLEFASELIQMYM